MLAKVDLEDRDSSLNTTQQFGTHRSLYAAGIAPRTQPEA